VISHFLRGHPAVNRAIISRSLDEVCISAVTEGEIHYGLALRPPESRYVAAAQLFMDKVEILPWDHHVATTYGPMRADLQRAGLVLSHIDLLSAAHALTIGAVLVTNDKALHRLPMVEVVDWTRDL
jgi:tRNA(fMet)-specific endonuclease VapC